MNLLQLMKLEHLGLGVFVQGRLSGLGSRVRIGDGVSMNDGFVVRGKGRLEVGSHVHFGQNVTILTSNHNYRSNRLLPYDKEHLKGEVKIGDCVWVGDRVVIVPGVSVGEGAILAAGAVIVKDVDPFAIVGGAPAKRIAKRDRETYQELKDSGAYLGWPRDLDSINGRKCRVPR